MRCYSCDLLADLLDAKIRRPFGNRFSLALLSGLCIFLTYSSAFAIDLAPLDSKIKTLAYSKQWLRLLHFKRTFPFRLHRSRILAESPFFIDSKGYKDPEAEMRADILAFESGGEIGRTKQHPQCAFPERFRFLKKELGLNIAPVRCAQLDEFIQKLNPHSVTLVFSAAFPSNPGSMFGHTFFRFNSKTKSVAEKKVDLLDYGVSFAAAIPDNENGLAFAFFGLTGGYYGMFSIVPYYVKVAEYINNESRDLWEYELSLNEQETMSLLRHLWEIDNNALFPYFFFDENCAFILLAMLEVVKPEWDISSFPIYVIPAETVKRVADVKGAVVNTKFRPSLRKKMLAKYDALSSSQRSQFMKMIDPASAVNLAEIKDIPATDAAISYMFFLKQKEKTGFSTASATRLKHLLLRRSEMGQAPPGSEVEPALPEDSRPDKAHNTYRLGTSSGLQGHDFFQEIQFKFAFHDLLNDDTGYIKFSHIDFPSISLRYIPARSRFWLEEVSGLALTSLNPISRLERGLSWKFNFGYQSPKDYGCTTCHVAHGEGGVGAAFEVFHPNYLFYTFATAAAELGQSLRMGYRIVPKAQAGFLMNPWRPYKLLLAPSVVFDLVQGNDRQPRYYPVELTQSFSLSQWFEVRAGILSLFRSSKDGARYNEAKLSLNFYF